MTDQKNKKNPPGELELFTGVVMVLVIGIQLAEYFRTGCFSFAGNNEICGDWVHWLIWVVVVFEAAFPIITAYKYFKFKRSQKI